MATLLQLNTSLFRENGASSRLSRTYVEAWRRKHPDGKIIVRDLAAEPVPHLDANRLTALSSEPDNRTASQQAIVDLSDTLIAELRAADTVVIGLPLYNFGMPSTLKSWFDHVLRAGITFRYTADGPEGLVGDRKVHVLAARGDFYKDTPQDTQTPFLTTLLNFIGIEDIEFVYAEGLAVSDEAREQSMDRAFDCVQAIAA